MKHVTPSIREPAFNCPQCHAFAQQYWYSLRVKRLEGKRPLDRSKIDFDRPEGHVAERGSYWSHLAEDPTVQTSRLSQVILAGWMDKGNPFIWRSDDRESLPFLPELHNVFLSKCAYCEEVSVWIYDRLVHPLPSGAAPPANPDLSDDIRRDYDEASHILDESPRGAAALIRLALQKLCIELGQPGKNLNDDIKALVKAGLDPTVQQALAARGGSTFSELRWYPPVEAAKGSLSWVFRAKQPESVRTGP